MILSWVACDFELPEVVEPEVEPVVAIVQEDPRCSRSPGDAPEGCVSGVIRCGEVVDGHTGGGLARWSNDFYREKFCAPIHHDWDGPERVYRFEMEPMLVANVELESPCEDLDLFAASWPHEGCPDLEHSVTACESDVLDGDGAFRLVTQENPQTWLIAVDGKRSAQGAFTLSVECQHR